MVQKSSLFEIDKGRETVFPIKHSGLIGDARLKRWSDSALKSTSGPEAILAVWLLGREEMHSAAARLLPESRPYLLNIRGVASDAATDGQTVTVPLKQWPLRR